MTRHWQTGHLIVVTFVVGMLAACGPSGPTGDVGKIKVEISSMSVSVRNTAGMPLTNIKLAIVPLGGAAPYRTVVDRLENDDVREFSLSNLRDPNGAPFDARVAKARSVTVTATDFNGKPVAIEVPWK
jgi:hypothetical protein